MIGIFLSAVAAVLFGSSTALQKYCLKKMKNFSLRRLLTRRLWTLSIIIALVGIISYDIALAFESITVVQPMISISIIIPVLAGRIFFGERIGLKWFHIALILAGVVLLSL